jgi:alpha-galactosidase
MPTASSSPVRVTPAAVTFDLADVHFRGGGPACTVLVGTKEKVVVVQLQGKTTEATRTRRTPVGRVSEHTWRGADTRGLGLAWTVGVLHSGAGFTMQATFYNNGPAPVRLRNITLCSPGTTSIGCDGDAQQWHLSSIGMSSRIGSLAEVLPSVNEQITEMWKGFGLPAPALGTDERSTDGRWRGFTDFMTLYRDDLAPGLVIGPVGAPRAFVNYQAYVAKGIPHLEIVSDMSDVVVAPGEARESQEIIVLSGAYDQAVTTVLHWLAQTHGARTARGPAFGWCSWYDCFNGVSAPHVEKVADYFAHLQLQAPEFVIQIDDGFQRQVGDWACNDKFPDGWAPVVKKINTAHAVAGIWLAPLAVHDSTGLLQQHPDWFARYATGELFGAISNWGPTAHWLDPTQPAARRFLRTTLRAAYDAGFRYFKIDFNTVGGRFYNPRQTSLEVYRDLYKMYRQTIGTDSYLLACSQFSRGVFGYADAVRIGPDSGADWRALHPCTIVECIHAVGTTALANGLICANDPDVSYTKPRGSLTGPEVQTWHSMVGLLGGTAMVSEPMFRDDYIDTTQRLEMLCPPAPEKGRSFNAGTDPEHRQFGFVSKRPWGTAASILLYNPTESVGDVALDTRQLQELGPRFHVWSFWDECYLGLGDASFVARGLPAHGPALLRLTAPPADANQPILIGSTLHISMGAAEITGVHIAKQGMKIRLSDAGARTGKLFVYTPRALTLTRAVGCQAALSRANKKNIWIVNLSDRQHGKSQSIDLAIAGQ